MLFNKTTIGSTALAALLLAVPLHTAPVDFAASAQAATDVSVNFFFGELSRHGDWVRHRDRYVFVPARIERGWRPYTLGHWVYAERYGWTWVSDEPFGHITYHYGRWGFNNDIGWYWVPGSRWAPAWVSWRRSADHVVWAPLPPSADGDVSVTVSIGAIPDYYWVAVPVRYFLVPDLRVRIVIKDSDRRRIVRAAEPVGSVRIRNNIVVNTAIDIEVVERETGEKARRVKVRETGDPREARASDEEVTAFQGEIQADAEAKPERVKEKAEVRDERRKRGDKVESETGEDADGMSTGSTTRAKGGDDQAPEDGQKASEPEDNGTATDEGQAKAKQDRKKDKKADEPVTDEGQGKAKKEKKKADEPVTEEDQTKAKKKDRGKANEADEPGMEEGQGQTERKKDRRAKDGEAGKGKSDRQRQDCDPAVSPDCAPQP